MFESGTDQLLVEMAGRVARITLNRPEARNALSDELTGDFRRAIAWATDAPEVGAVLVTGAGGAFCSGGDVKAMGQRNANPDQQPSVEQAYQALRARHQEIGGALRAMRKPTVAALPGAAAGAGMAIALCCDLRIAAKRAFLTTGYARVGLSGDYGIAWLLSRVVGPARARELLLTVERVGASRALEIGLVNEVVPDDALADRTLTLTDKLANGPLVAYQYIKDNLDEALDIDHRKAIDREADRIMKDADDARSQGGCSRFCGETRTGV